jgi:hypothetical protein
MSKNVVKTEGQQMTSQYGESALHAWKARLHARTLMHTPTRPGAYCLSTKTIIRERDSVLRYTYTVCPVNFVKYVWLFTALQIIVLWPILSRASLEMPCLNNVRYIGTPDCSFS